MAANYDPAKLQEIAGRYQGYGENSQPQYQTNSVSSPSQSNNYLGNVFNSIKSGIGAVGGAVGNAIVDTAYRQPAALSDYIGTRVGKAMGAPSTAKQAGENYKKVVFSATKSYQSGKLKYEDFKRITDSAKKMYDEQVGGAGKDVKELATLQLTPAYYKKAAPVALTALSLAAASPLAGSAAKGLGAFGKSGGIVNKTAIKAGSAVDSLFAPGQALTKGGNPLTQILNLGGKLARKELVINPTLQSVGEVPGDINNLRQGKDIAGSLGSLAQVATPAILSGGKKGIDIGKNALGKAIYDTSGMFDRVKLKGGVSVNEAFKAFKTELKDNPKIVKATENRLRQLQDIVLKESGGNAKLASQNLARYQSSKNQFTSMDLDQFVKDATAHFKGRLAAQNAAAKGVFDQADLMAKVAKGEGNVTVARLSQTNKQIIKDRLTQATDKAKELKLLKKEGLVQNKNLYGQLEDIISGDAKLIRGRINDIVSGTPLLVKGKPQEFENGYFAVYSKNAGKLVSDVKGTQGLQSGQQAILSPIGNALRKAGLSTEEVTAQDNQYVFNKIKNAFQESVDGIGDKTGKHIYNKLNNLAEKTTGVTDIRQLSASKIQKDLNVTGDQAKQIVKAAKNAYKGLTLEERGLAGKLMDFNLRVNPLAAPYSRVQSIARYEKNPFFRLQENIETRTGLATMGGKQVRPGNGAFDKTVTKLNERGIFTSGYGAEGADSFSGSFNGVKAKLSRDQERNIAGSIEKWAGGPDKVDSWLSNPKNASLLNDIKTIVQYPDKGFTSSNLAKMMNLVAFPTRYNLKVTQFAVKQLAKQPGAVQIAVIKGLGDFDEFTKSPEGIKWQADNKEAIGLMKYFTPIQPVSAVIQTLRGENKSVGDLGMVGGLPFGVITRILTGQGLLKDRLPYVDPRSGKVYSDRVPEDLKARADSLLNSIVDTLYTYPGRTAGAETSKKQFTQGVVDNATFGQLKDGKYSNIDRSQDVSPAQQRQIDILTSLQSGSPAKQPTNYTAQSIPKITTQDVIKGLKYYKAPKSKKSKAAKTPSRPISSLF